MSRYVSPVFEINDGNGAPRVGAKLAFYEPGTTTLKTIYSDSGLSTPRTNPVTAVSSDAGAIYPDIYLDGLYKAVQQDATGTADTDDGAVIWTRDPVGEVATGQFDDWLNDETYDLNDIVKGSDNDFYRSLVASNQGNDPISSPTKWVEFYTDLTLTNPTISGFSGSVITLGTVAVTTSGTSVDYTGIPSWVKKIHISFVGVSADAAKDIVVELGDAGGLETSGYLSSTDRVSAGGVTTSTAAFTLAGGLAADILHGVATLVLVDSSTNTWAFNGVFLDSNVPTLYVSAGSKSLSDTLTQLSIKPSTAANFDAGKINITYE